MTQLDSNKFKCSMVYYGLSVNQDGSLDPCCQYTRDNTMPIVQYSNFEYFQNHVREPINQDAQKEQQHAGCQKCWSEESAGWTTLRQFANRWYPLIPDQGFYQRTAQGYMDWNPIKHVELRLGNFCNLKCMMCTPGSSSSVQVERITNSNAFAQIGLYPLNVKSVAYWEDPAFLTFCEQRLFKDVERINITGGEPFIIPEVLKMLDRLVAREQYCTVCFDTNLTQVSDRLIEKLSQFSRLEIIVSLEGIGVKNDYVRYPSRWHVIEQNIARIRERVPQALISVNHTLQHTSVYALPELAEYCYHNRISWHVTTVQGFDFLTFDSVPELDLEKFQRWVDTCGILTQEQQTFLGNIIAQTRYNPTLFQKFQEYVNVLDQIRNTNYAVTFNPTGI